MAKVDLHVHSKYSSHASEWFLKRLGASESYTEPEEVYRRAKEKGMRFVTLTDHNRIEGVLLLKEKYPDDVFTGCESTAYFPEDGCKVHILFYGISAQEFGDIEALRHDIYQLRDYIRANDIAYSVAHATYDVNDRLTRSHLEKLILLFDVFEGITGSEDKLTNRCWMDLLKSLTPRQMETLEKRRHIKPFGKDSWVKGITGGSDDHAGMYIGETFTRAGANTPEDFLACIKNKLTWAEGRHSDYQSFVFSIYKIAFEFLRRKNPLLAHSVISHLNESLFNNQKVSWFDKLKMFLYQPRKSREKAAKKIFMEFYDGVRSMEDRGLDDKLKQVYARLASLTDQFFKQVFQTFEKNLAKGNFGKTLQDLSGILPGAFLTVPFFSSLKHLFRGRHFVREMRADLFPENGRSERRILWFTDTLADLNDAAESIQETALAAARQGMQLTVVVPADEKEVLPRIPGLVRIPFIHAFSLPFYESVTLKIPSVLQALQIIYENEPDEILISTPGPAGLLGLLTSKLLNIKASSIFHTDFAAQALALSAEEDFVQIIQNYIRWFYCATDSIKVPNLGYRNRLLDLDYPVEKIHLYRKGLDTELFAPRAHLSLELRRQLPHPNAPVLMYAGRISKDKNLHFLLRVFSETTRQKPLNLVLAGEGPDLDELRRQAGKWKGVLFLGRKDRRQLPDYYSAADLFVFPSVTDTFGMVVLEAQACGLPALVSDQGGPKEIVVHRKTGLIVAANDAEAWVRGIQEVLDMKQAQPGEYEKMKWHARQNVVEHYQWARTLATLFLEQADAEAASQIQKAEAWKKSLMQFEQPESLILK